jgi:hypothetical protein
MVSPLQQNQAAVGQIAQPSTTAVTWSRRQNIRAYGKRLLTATSFPPNDALGPFPASDAGPLVIQAAKTRR